MPVLHLGRDSLGLETMNKFVECKLLLLLFNITILFFFFPLNNSSIEGAHSIALSRLE